jgi:DnaK suppressor protein
MEFSNMWMTREEIAEKLGIVVNSVRGKVQKGQIERKILNGKNMYRIVQKDVVEKTKGRQASRKTPPEPGEIVEPPDAAPIETKAPEPAPVRPTSKPTGSKSQEFNPKKVLLDQLASISVGRNIEAIEKGDEIDLATDEISRELDAKISMRQRQQIKEIEDALERIKYGDYGECEECGEPIPEQRLRLFPAARNCVRCQEEVDRYDKIKQHQGLAAGGFKEDSQDVYMKPSED